MIPLTIPAAEMPFITYTARDMNSTMDFPLNGMWEGVNNQDDILDLDQPFSAISGPSFEDPNMTFMPEKPLATQTNITAAHHNSALHAEHDTSMELEITQPRAPQNQQMHQEPPATVESQASRRLSPQCHPFPTDRDPRSLGGSAATPTVLDPRLGVSGVNLSRSDRSNTTGPSTQANARNASTCSPVPYGSDRAQPDLTSDNDDLDSRFERVIRAVEDAGFESIDQMSALYYTAIFKEDTVSHWAQSRSRSRSLHAFLALLHESTTKWSPREVQGYRQHITGAAEKLYIDEFLHARKEILKNQVCCGENCKIPTPSSPSTLGVQSLWQTIADMELSPEFKMKKAMIREQVFLRFPNLFSPFERMSL
jgi:hypothetical protein